MAKHADVVEFEVVKDADGKYRIVLSDGSEGVLLFPDIGEVES